MRERNEKRKTEAFKRIRRKENFQNYFYPDPSLLLQSRRQTCHEKIFMIVPFVLIGLSIKNASQHRYIHLQHIFKAK